MYAVNYAWNFPVQTGTNLLCGIILQLGMYSILLAYANHTFKMSLQPQVTITGNQIWLKNENAA